MGEIASFMQNALNPACAANVMSVICSFAYRQCKQVEDRPAENPVWLPSLLCRSDCERHLETWHSCLDNLEHDPDAKRNFETQMAQAVTCLSFVFLCALLTYFF
jgi:hypothetical protein